MPRTLTTLAVIGVTLLSVTFIGGVMFGLALAFGWWGPMLVPAASALGWLVWAIVTDIRAALRRRRKGNES